MIADGADDVRLVALGGGVSQDVTPTGQADDVDIRSVTFGDETETDFTITLQMKALPAQASGTLFRAVYFELDEVRYRAILGGRGGGMPQGSLQSYDEGVQRYRSVGSIAAQQDASGAKIVFTVPRELVTNKQHVPVRHGDHLMNLYASATKFIAGAQFLPTGDPTGGASMVDRAPDSGHGDHFLFVKGRVGAGHLMLSAPEPVRVSNGEATTIVYRVEAMNHGEREERIQLEATDLQGEWDVRLPSLLRVPAHGSLVFPVILSLPETHEHGVTALFDLKAVSLEDANTWSSVRLGVYWTETPQPAGHHPRMWLHSSPGDFGQDPVGVFGTAFPFRSVWMNPLIDEVDPDADDANVPAFFNNELAATLFGVFDGSPAPPGGSSWTTEWFIPMAPALLIGLDFDLARQGQLETAIKHALPAQQAQVRAELLYCDPEKPTAGPSNANCTAAQGFANERWSTIAQGTSLASAASADEVVRYSVPLTVDPVADLLPYKHGANIGLRITLITDVPANTIGAPPRPELVLDHPDVDEPLLLPLIEYHDPIDQAFESVGNLRLTSLVPFEKKVNPGETTVFRFKLENKGSLTEEVVLEVHGENVEWTRLVGETRLRLAPQASRDVELVVEVPKAGTAEGARAELFLVAESVNDPAIVALIRLRATVVESEDIPDEAASVAGKGGAPTPGWGFVEALVVAAGVAVLALRRRRA